MQLSAGFQRYVRGLALFALILAGVSTAAPEGADEASDNPIRVSRDGAGPSHIFWIGRRVGSVTDVIGVIDPLYAAIHFFEVDPVALAPRATRRIRPAGACALPIELRPWRVHQTKDAILIETMPAVGTAAQNIKPENATTRMYAIARSVADTPESKFATAQTALPTPDWNPPAFAQCGEWNSADGKLGAGIGLTAERGAHNPNRTIILTNGTNALAPPETLIVRTPKTNPNRLMSARELEPTERHRTVLVSEGLGSADGMLRVRQRLLIFARGDQSLVGEMSFDDTYVRSKLGFRPVTVLPTGEVIAMGKYHVGDNTSFQIVPCGSIAISTPQSPPLCGHTEAGLEYRQTPDLVDVAQPSEPAQDFEAGDSRPQTKLTIQSIFDNAEPLFTFPFEIDTTQMPRECRLAEGCDTGQVRNGKPLNFVPIRGIRLTRGQFRRTGVPYAQADLPGDLDGLLGATPGQLATALKNVRNGSVGLPGNLMDYWEHDYGIDCSGLVQVAWGAKQRPSRNAQGKEVDRLSTEAIQNFADGLLCTSRLPGPDYMKPGDIVALNVAGATQHVMLYAATLRPENGNDAWLMLESSSSCDGVCWTVYDPSFFNGWGLYRSNGRSDFRCPARTDLRAKPIPMGYDLWVAQVRKPVLLEEVKR